MTGVILIISAVCLIIAGQIPEYELKISNNYCNAYSSPIFKILITIAKYSSILPVFSYLYYAGYGEISWFFKLIIWAVSYIFIKIIGIWLFVAIFGLGRGGTGRSIILLIIGIITFIVA